MIMHTEYLGTRKLFCCISKVQTIQRAQIPFDMWLIVTLKDRRSEYGIIFCMKKCVVFSRHQY